MINLPTIGIRTQVSSVNRSITADNMNDQKDLSLVTWDHLVNFVTRYWLRDLGFHTYGNMKRMVFNINTIGRRIINKVNKIRTRLFVNNQPLKCKSWWHKCFWRKPSPQYGGRHCISFPTWIFVTSEHTNMHCHCLLDTWFWRGFYIRVWEGSMVWKPHMKITHKSKSMPIF